MDTKTIARFWAKVDTSGACWVWTACTARGYGRFAVKPGDMHSAHRLSWILANGPVPDGLFVLHRCDNRPCVNPDHLFLGTQAENMADKARKGRAARGTGHGCSKLSNANIHEIRSLGAAGVTQRKIASQFGVSQPMVGMILRREKWAHIE